jgi:hypothetical protein
VAARHPDPAFDPDRAFVSLTGGGGGARARTVNIYNHPWYVRLAAYVAIVLAITVGVTAARSPGLSQGVQISTLQR